MSIDTFTSAESELLDALSDGDQVDSQRVYAALYQLEQANGHVSDETVATVASIIGVSERTIRRRVAALRTSGTGVGAARRSWGAWSGFKFDDWMLALVVALNGNLLEAHRQLVAAGIGVPSYAHFTRLWKAQPLHIREFARNGRNSARRVMLYCLYEVKFRNAMWQIDMTPADINVMGHWNKSRKKCRPYITICMDSYSRLILAVLITLDRPTEEDTAALLVDASRLKVAPNGVVYGGRPGEVMTDNAKEYISKLIHGLARRLRFVKHTNAIYTPMPNGKCEKLLGDINRKVTTATPGWIPPKGVNGFNGKQLLSVKKGNLITDTDLLNRVADAVYEHNFVKVHATLGMTPIDKWATSDEPVEELTAEEIEMALFRTDEKRKLQSAGIEFRKIMYMSHELCDYDVGTQFLLGYLRHDPSFIHVYDENGKFVCRAEPVKEMEKSARNKVYARRLEQLNHLEKVEKLAVTLRGHRVKNGGAVWVPDKEDEGSVLDLTGDEPVIDLTDSTPPRSDTKAKATTPKKRASSQSLEASKRALAKRMEAQS